MALLTAEDVLNKAFSKTKYREGFDQDEVDDFLDEVAHTITSLIAERDDLAARLQAAQSAQTSAPAMADPFGSGATPAQPTRRESRQESAPTTNAFGAMGEEASNPTGMIQMAQKLHDEYVASGEQEKERILSEATAKAEEIMSKAEQDAQQRMGDLVAERGELERKIDDLRRFERDYRARLTTYLENLLGDLDHGAGKDRAPGDGETP